MRSNQEIINEVNFLSNSGLTPNIVTSEQKESEVRRLINGEARTYLASTDWYVIRFMETGVEIPEEITENRELARTKVVE